MVTVDPSRYVLLKGQARISREYGSKCKREHLPIVYSRQTGKHAVVEMDLIYVHDSHRYSSDLLFRERMMEACEDAAGDYTQSFLPGLYTYVPKVPVENAETLAQAFLAIYDQSRQINTEIPVFKNIKYGPVRSRLEDARKVGYCIARGVADYLPLRYQLWCQVNNQIYICVWKRNPTRAEVRIDLGSLPPPSNFVERMEQIAHELEIPLMREMQRYRTPFITIEATSVGVHGRMDIDKALRLAEYTSQLFK